VLVEGLPSPGDVLLVGRAASVQFRTPITFRLIRVIPEWVTYDRWVWLHGYQLDERGNATAKRDIFVQPAGLHRVRRAAAPVPRRQANQRPVRPRTAGPSPAPSPSVPALPEPSGA
jgi:hypothetical protein